MPSPWITEFTVAIGGQLHARDTVRLGRPPGIARDRAGRPRAQDSASVCDRATAGTLPHLVSSQHTATAGEIGGPKRRQEKAMESLDSVRLARHVGSWGE